MVAAMFVGTGWLTASDEPEIEVTCLPVTLIESRDVRHWTRFTPHMDYREYASEAELRVAAILTLEPERSTNFFNIAPRLMMNEADLPSTGLLQPGSRAWYYLYTAGAPQKITAFESWGRTGDYPQ